MRLLLGSGGIGTPDRKQAWIDQWGDFLGGITKVLFVAWAVDDCAGHTERMQKWMEGSPVTLDGIHTHDDPVQAVNAAEAIFFTGGNTFRLVKQIHDSGILEPVRARVRAGVPYIGISAGTNVSAPTMATTNDMPICCPPSHETFGLIPFQVNPHFVPGTAYYVIDGKIVPYGGETREQRLREYHEMNDLPILCLREGAILRVEEGEAVLKGPNGAILLRKGVDAEVLPEGTDVSYLLTEG
jgi:dipeptidase E